MNVITECPEHLQFLDLRRTNLLAWYVEFSSSFFNSINFGVFVDSNIIDAYFLFAWRKKTNEIVIEPFREIAGKLRMGVTVQIL